MSNLLQMGTDFEKKLKERAVSTENMLNSEFRKLEASVDRELNLNGQKIRDAISAHTAALKEQCRERAVQRHRERTGPAAGRAALEADQRADTVPVADGALRHGRDFSGVMGADSVAGKPDCGEHPGYQGPGRDAGETPGKNMGVTYHEGRNGKFLVLPSGVKGENNWTVEKKNAIRLVRE